MFTGPPISTVVVSSVTTAIAVIHTDQDEINTDVYEPVSSSAHQLSTAELVGLVIGAALLALLIIALVALLFVRCCCHDQQPQAGVFGKSPLSFLTCSNLWSVNRQLNTTLTNIP